MYGCETCQVEICETCNAPQTVVEAVPEESVDELESVDKLDPVVEHTPSIVEHRIDPEDGAEYTLAEFRRRYATAYSEAEIEQYWREECRPMHQIIVPAMQDSAEGVKTTQDHPSETGASSTLPEHSEEEEKTDCSKPDPGPPPGLLGELPLANAVLEQQPLAPDSLPADDIWKEPVTPRECSTEGCTFFAGAEGLCSCCYREKFGCAPPPPPPRKMLPRAEEPRESNHSEEEGGPEGGSEPKKKRKRKKKKKKDDDGHGEDEGIASDGLEDDGIAGCSGAAGSQDPPPLPSYGGHEGGERKTESGAVSERAECRINPEDDKEYTFQEFYQRHADYHSREEIESYWFNECRPVVERRALAVQDSLAEILKELQGQHGLASLGAWASNLNLDTNPALSMLSEIGRLHSLQTQARQTSPPEPVAPFKCSTEGCTSSANVAGLCAVCYRDAFGCETSTIPSTKEEFPSDDEGVAEGSSETKKKRKKKKKKGKIKEGDGDAEDEGAHSDDQVEGEAQGPFVRNIDPELPEDLGSGPSHLELPSSAVPPQEEKKGQRRREEIRSHLEANGLLVKGVERSCGLVYDEIMQEHRGPAAHPEQPERIAEIWKQLGDAGLIGACQRLPSRVANKKELLYVHTEYHVDRVLEFKLKPRKEGDDKKKDKSFSFPFGPDTYVCDKSAHCASVSAGCLLSLVDHAMKKNTQLHCGMAVIRPPGHHASADKISGFCLFNNVAIAARHLQKKHKLERVMIVDWDVHHGNGTNSIFSESKDVLFFSMHRYDPKGFFPGSGTFEDVGKAPAEGYSVNVPLSKGYSDSDAVHVMRYVLFPLFAKFKPEAILVSAGFDAVRGDPLGGCYMTPQGYAWMTRCLYRLARHYCDGRLFLALEGGYDCPAIARCAVECVNALVLESAGVAALDCTSGSLHKDGPEGTPMLAPSMPGTPVFSPCPSPLLSPRGSSQHSSPAGSLSPKASPSTLSKQKGHSSHVEKTVHIVRKLTELHNALQLELPLAPKELHGHGAQNAKKNAKRKQRKRADSDGSDEDTQSDCSGWAIAVGTSDCEGLRSPKH